MRKSATRTFADRYAEALQTYLRHPSEDGLTVADGLGRRALAEGVGVMEIIEAHFAAADGPPQSAGRHQDPHPDPALVFLLQAVAASQIVHTGFAEAQGRVAVERLHVRRLQSLARAATRITASRDPERLPRVVVQQTRQVFQAEGAALVFHDQVAARTGRLPVGVGSLDGHRDFSHLLGVRSWTGGPRTVHWLAALVRQRKADGMLAVWRPDDPFDEFEQTLFEQHASRVAVIVHNTTVSAREHEVAAGLQQSLLPRKLPDTPHVAFAARYRPAEAELSVGGDWYDAFTLDGDEVAFAVGDVMGHGVGAAALMGQIRIAIRAYAAADRSPASVLAGVDRLLHSWEDDCIVTVAYVVLRADGTLQVANAGHPPPLIVRPDGGNEFGPAALSVPLGADADAKHPDQTVRLEPGSTVLLYSDGLVERPDVPVDQRLARLQAAAGPADLSPDERCDRVLSAMLGEKRRDDVCLLAARWLPA